MPITGGGPRPARDSSPPTPPETRRRAGVPAADAAASPSRRSRRRSASSGRRNDCRGRRRVDIPLRWRTLPPMSPVLRACQGLPTRTFAAGEAVLEEGSPAGELFVLASGSVEIVKGDVQITTVSDPGSFFGEMSVLLGRPHTG